MKREKNRKTAKFVEALEYIDVKYIEEAGKKIKERPTAGVLSAPQSRSKALRQVLALVACVLLLSAVIPAVTYLASHLPDIIGASTGENTTEQTDPETPPEETSSPAPETSVNTDHETTAPLYDGTTAPPEPEHNGSYGLEYKMNEDGRSAMLFHRGICTDENVIVASVWNGVPVTRISEAALAEYVKYNTVAIPESVTAIDMRAFKNCTGLESVVLHDGISYIGADAFENCVALTEITLPKSLEWIQTGLFMNCINLQKVIIGNEVERIVFGAFYDCSALRELHYLGTKAEWNKIQKDLDWNVKSAITVVHCSDGDVEITPYTPDDAVYDGSQGLEYRIDGDHAVLVGIGTCTDKDIVTATTYNGLPVTEIDGLGLSGYKGITSVTVSEGVTHIEMCAFSSCPDLRAVYLPSTLQFLSAGEGIAFENCDNIDTIKVADSNPKYYSVGNCLIERGTGNLVLACSKSVLPSDGSIKSIGQFAFGGSDSLEKIVIPEGVTVINPYAFAGCASLKSVTFPDSLTTVRWDAFANCTSLESVKLGDNVTEIGSRVFSGCSSLVDITLPGRVDSFGEEIFAGCPIESIVIPNGVKILHGGMFANCKNLKNVTLPDGIETIVGFAFAYCSSLEKITLPRSVTKIQGEVFTDCSSLTELTFKGTKAEWKAIEKQDGWNRNCSVTVVHCSDGDVKIESEQSSEYSEGLEFLKFADYSVLVGIGSCKDSEIVIPATYEGVPVTEIWDRAFYQVSGMTSVTIPEGVTYIESEAFLNCPDLREISLPATLENISGSLSLGFMNCPALEVIKIANGNAKYFVKNNCLIEKSTGKLVLGGGKAVIPTDGSVKSIGAHAFAGNLLLGSVAIPEDVSVIYTSAFENCKNLTSVTLPKTLLTVRQSAFKGCASLTSLILPDSVTEIYNSAFAYCTNLKNITLSKNLTMIDSEAFISCAVEKIVIPSKVKELGAVFSECTKLKSVTLPDGFERFVGSTFSYCTALESINLPASLKYIGFYTFNDCTSLKNLNFGGTTTEWNAVEKQERWNEDAAFTSVKCSDGEIKFFSDGTDEGSTGLEYEIKNGQAVLVGIGTCTDKNIVIAPTFGGIPVTMIDKSAFYNCQFIESVVIPEGVTVICDEAFYLCKNLREVTLPSTLDIIRSWAFANCESLEKIALPDGIMIIEIRAFSDCGKLSSLTLGAELQSIEENAFMNCTSLKSVTIPAKVLFFGNSAFSGCTSLESVTLKKGVEMIGDGVFSGCSGLTSIKYTGKIADWEKIGTYPDWMKGSSIERVICSDGDARLKDTFDGTPGLTYVVSKDGKSAFLAGIGVFTGSEIVVATEYNGLPITSIAYRVINNAPNLTSIHISKTVIDLPDELFYQCDKVVKLTVDPDNPVFMSAGNCIIEKKSGKLLFGCNASVIPAGVKSIGESAFASCSGLKSLTLPEGLEAIEARAFSNCTSLSSITFPESLLSVGEFAFYNCSSLESIVFGSKVKTVGGYAFSTCTGLRSISLPDTAVLGDSAFYYCSSLRSVKVPAAQTSLNGTFLGCSSLESVILPDTLTALRGSTFYGCTSLKSITLPASVKEINGGEFSDCTSLTDFNYGGTVAEWNAICPQHWQEGAAFTTVKCKDGTVPAKEVDEDEAIPVASEYLRIS